MIYVIAPKRQFRAFAPENWQTAFAETDGVEVLGFGPARMEVAARPEVIEGLRERFSERFHIEEAIRHHTVSS